MRKVIGMAMMLALLSSAGWAAEKQQGKATLKNFQPAGTPDKKQKQQYDLTFSTPKDDFTCRSNENEKVDATQWVVGSGINYKVDGNKGQIKNMQSGKSVKCTIVRVAAAQ